MTTISEKEQTTITASSATMIELTEQELASMHGSGDRDRRNHDHGHRHRHNHNHNRFDFRFNFRRY